MEPELPFGSRYGLLKVPGTLNCHNGYLAICLPKGSVAVLCSRQLCTRERLNNCYLESNHTAANILACLKDKQDKSFE